MLSSIVLIAASVSVAPCLAALPEFNTYRERFDGLMKPLLKAFDNEQRETFLLDMESKAVAGNPYDQYYLGRVYKEGVGRPRDVEKAVRLFRASAEQGMEDSMFELFLYLSNRNSPEAMFWLKAAAEQGSLISQYFLGLMFDGGKNVPKNNLQAYFWLLLASTDGNKNAVAARDAVARRLSPQEKIQIQQQAQSWRPIAAQPMKYDPQAPITRRMTKMPDGPDATGSGFMVAAGKVVTNYHVIDGCSTVKADGFEAKVLAGDARGDLALLSTIPHGRIAAIRTKRTSVGDNVAVAGFPLRGMLSGFNMTTGGISSLSGYGGDTRLLQISAPVQPGNSGGPLLDSSGSVAGVVVSKLDALKAAKLTGDIPQNVNFAINVNSLRSFLDANGVDYELSDSAASISNTAVADKAKRFTALIECWK